MKKFNSNLIFPSVHSFEEYENLKFKREILENAARKIIALNHLPDEPLSLFEGTNIVFAYGNNRVIKIFPPLHESHFTSERLMLKHLHHKISINTPALEYEGEIEDWPYIIMSRLEGTLLEGLWEKIDRDNKMILIRELGALIHEMHSIPTMGLELINCHWQLFIDKQIDQCVAHHQALGIPNALIQQISNYLESNKACLPKIKNPVILTGEYTPMNLLVKQTSGIWHINGLIDFGDSMLGLPEYDLLGPGAFLIQGDKKLLREFLISYGYLPEEMTPTLSRQLTVLMLLHRYSNLEVQIRIKDWKSKVNNLNDLENLVWGL